MKLRNHPARLQKRAAIDTAKKMRLEIPLAKDMRRVLKSMVKDFKLTYPKRQETILPHKYKSDVEGILRGHYRKVINAFASSARDELSTKKSLQLKKVSDIWGKIDSSTKAKLAPYTFAKSEKQAAYIIQTTHDGLIKAVQKAINDKLTAGEEIDSKEIADIVSSDYTAKIAGRADVISVTETQSMAEKTKLTEIAEIAGSDDMQELLADDADDIDPDDPDSDDEDTPSAAELKMVWVALLDDKTREEHADADGQVVGIDEPFIVGGEELEYPGDDNGSDWNICNCRCASVAITD